MELHRTNKEIREIIEVWWNKNVMEKRFPSIDELVNIFRDANEVQDE